jgi:glucokinase
VDGQAPGRRTAGVDLGGTSLRIGLLDERDSILASTRTATPSELTASTLVRLIEERLGRLIHSTGGHSIGAMGLALPGILDDRGTVLCSVHLPGLEGSRPATALTERLGVPVLALTDADAATLGEFHWLPPPRPRRMVHLRLGTGVACSLIADGRPLPIERERRGHLEILVVDSTDGATACPCGRWGCLETIGSGRALEARAVEAGIAGGLASLQAAWLKRESAALHVVSRAADAVLAALARIVQRLDPECIGLGGGAIEHVPALADEIFARWSVNPSAVRLLRASRGDDAGILGAGAFVRMHSEFGRKQSTP